LNRNVRKNLKLELQEQHAFTALCWLLPLNSQCNRLPFSFRMQTNSCRCITLPCISYR